MRVGEEDFLDPNPTEPSCESTFLRPWHWSWEYAVIIGLDPTLKPSLWKTWYFY